MGSRRLLSHTELETAQVCRARWDFRYGGRLAGSTLKPRTIPRILNEGRAWGTMVATWHALGGGRNGLWRATEAMHDSLGQDFQEARENGGTFAREDYVAAANLLSDALLDYVSRTPPMSGLHRMEEEIIARVDNQHSLLAKIDGWWVDADDRPWLVEFKWRPGGLTAAWLLELLPQFPRYAWALREAVGVSPVGIIVDERLGRSPQRPKLVQGRKKSDGLVVSSDKAQFTTGALYVEACQERGQDPDRKLIEHYDSREWQQQVRIVFRQSELDATHEELRELAQVIYGLDHGQVLPIRTASKMTCMRCDFRDICKDPTHPTDQFMRGTPKRTKARI